MHTGAGLKTRTEPVENCLDAEFPRQPTQGGIWWGPSGWRGEDQIRENSLISHRVQDFLGTGEPRSLVTNTGIRS